MAYIPDDNLHDPYRTPGKAYQTAAAEMRELTSGPEAIKTVIVQLLATIETKAAAGAGSFEFQKADPLRTERIVVALRGMGFEVRVDEQSIWVRVSW